MLLLLVFEAEKEEMRRGRDSSDVLFMLFWCSVFSHKRIRKYIEILFHALSIHFIVGAVNSAAVQNSGTLFSPLPICTLVITLIDC